MIRPQTATLLFLAATATAQTPGPANPYARIPRSGAVSVEIGMNTLASLVGVTGTFFLNPAFAVDLGLGLSGTGLRPGIRGRYLFSAAKFSGFGYGALKYGLGSGGQDFGFKDPENQAPLRIKTGGSPFLDLGAGVDYLAHNGFNFIGTLGWSFLLKEANYEWTAGTPSRRADDAARVAYGSGPALGLSLGYAFR